MTQQASKVCVPADYVTGNLTQSIFAKDCVFQDPTTRVEGVEKYSKAVALLFDKESSRADLISIQVHSSACSSSFRMASVFLRWTDTAGMSNFCGDNIE